MSGLSGLSGRSGLSGAGGGGSAFNFNRTDLRLAILPDLSPKYSDDGTTLITAHAASVYRINDLSSYGQHLRQTSAGSRPAIDIASGKTSLLFDGVADFMNATGTWNAKTAFTLIFAMNLQAYPAGSDSMIVEIGNGTFSNTYVASLNGTNMMTNAAYDGAVKGIYGVSDALLSPTTATWQLWTMKFTGSTWSIQRNDDTPVTASAGNSATDYTTFTLGAFNGGTRLANVKVGRMLYFDAALTGADLTSVKAYAATGYV